MAADMGHKRAPVELQVGRWYGVLWRDVDRKVHRSRGCCHEVDGDRVLLVMPLDGWPFPRREWFHRARLFRAPKPRTPPAPAPADA